MMPELVRYRNKPTQSGIFMVRYRIEFVDAGMLMPALVLLLPMPSYAQYTSVHPFPQQLTNGVH
jgi:hypothetical protein